MNYTQIILDKKGAVATLTLNRPGKVNAISEKMTDELADAIERVKKDNELRFLVFKGAGGNFCAGDDIGDFIHLDYPDKAFNTVRFYQHTANEIENLDLITIAAVEGYAVGGGLEITMVCDFVIAAKDAKFGIPEIDIGLTPGWGGIQRMGRFVGKRRIKEMIYLGILLDAKEAKAVQLVNKIVPNGKLDAAVADLIQVISTKPHEILKLAKFQIHRGLEVDLQTASGFEVLSSTVSFSTKAQKESCKSFTDKTSLWENRRKKRDEYYNKYPW